jgi:rod shape determining protein RodA
MNSRSQGADLPLVLLALLLTGYGVAMVYSAGQAAPQTGVSIREASAWIRQLQWLGVGLAGAFVASRVSLRLLEYLAWPIFIIATGLLVATVVGFGTGAGTASSTTSWLRIAGITVGQPSELAKIAVVFMLAKVLTDRKDPPSSVFQLWRPAVVVLIPCAIIIKQRDLGTALVLFGVFFTMIFWAGVRWQILVFLASPGISLLLAFSASLWAIWFILLTILVFRYRTFLLERVTILLTSAASGVIAVKLWEKLASHQQGRILVFLDPYSDPRGTGYNVIQSMTAIGAGGWFGQGFNQGTQKGLSFIPEQHTDFIFAVLGEELGFAGVSVALLLFLLLFLRTTRIASRATDSFSGLVAIGLTSIWLVHVIVNVGMTLNLVPVTGIPLPFFSYGGSFLLACWLSVGILHRISSEGRGQPDSLAL